MSYDPRDYCESDDELAREVLDAAEYGEYRQTVAERARVGNLARKHRNERLRDVTRPQPDPWGGAA